MTSKQVIVQLSKRRNWFIFKQKKNIWFRYEEIDKAEAISLYRSKVIDLSFT